MKKWHQIASQIHIKNRGQVNMIMEINITQYAYIFALFHFHILKECECVFISHTSKVMFKILQARLQHYMNCKLPDVQAGFRKGRGTRDQIANNLWIIEKARVPEKFLLLLY